MRLETKYLYTVPRALGQALGILQGPQGFNALMVGAINGALDGDYGAAGGRIVYRYAHVLRRTLDYLLV